MPTTYNGIGTHYYGKKNVERRQGTCRSCGGSVALTSYDTRLWFVVVFIPIIPLGRRRIVDHCPACTRHYAMDADKWETARQLGVSGAMEKFQSEPTPEAAMELHQTLLNFHQTAQAAEFRTAVAAKFPDHAKLHAYFGDALAHLGDVTGAASFHQRALALRPDLPEARAGVALQHIREGRLDEARQLLDFLEQPGAVQLYSLEPLEILGNACQRAGQHETALELFGKLLAALPDLEQHPALRKKVRASEKALKRRESILPQKKFSWKRMWSSNRAAEGRLTWRGAAIGAAVVVLIVGGMMVRNEYVRRHRTLHFVSGLKQPAHVFIRGVGSVDVGPAGAQLVLPEGQYHATITGPVHEEIDFEIASDYFGRWADDPVWLINVGGSALLLEQRITYAENPPPGSFTPRYGRTFEHLLDITHPFRALPETVQLKRGQQRVLTGLEIWREPAGGLVNRLVVERRQNEALDLAEWALRQRPDDLATLNAWLGAASESRHAERVEKTLAAGLARRPVSIAWHRAYQNLRSVHANTAKLTATYDAMLRDAPGDSALLYLRGRIAVEPDEERTYFERAIAADPRNPYPLFALGFGKCASGDWQGARPMLAKAAELLPEEEQFANTFFTCRLALGEQEALAGELQAAVRESQLDFTATWRLIAVLAAQDRGADAMRAAAGFASRVRDVRSEVSKPYCDALQRHALYSTGDFPALTQQATGDRSAGGRTALFEALVEQGRTAEAMRIYPLDEKAARDGFHFLTMSLALRQAGNAAEADAWRARGLSVLEAGGTDEAQLAALLRSPTPPPLADIAAISIDLKRKAVLCAALAAQYPAQRAEFHALTRRLNVDRSYPFHLLARLAAEP